VRDSLIRLKDFLQEPDRFAHIEEKRQALAQFEILLQFLFDLSFCLCQPNFQYGRAVMDERFFAAGVKDTRYRLLDIVFAGPV
jgi:hypothetical protein